MLVGKSYKLNFTGPFASIDQVEVTLDAVTSARTLIDYGVDVLNTIFISVGLSKTDYEDWLKGDTLLYTFRVNDVVYKVPGGYFTTAPEINTVNYRQVAVVIELPYITDSELTQVTELSNDLISLYESTVGLETEVTIKPYGATKPIEQSVSDQMQLSRVERAAAALNGKPSYGALQRTVIDYQVKLEGLEAIIIDRGIAD